MTRMRWPRLGLRREILILLPVTVFLLVLLSGFTLFAYRSAIDLLIEERQKEILTLGQQIALDLSSGPWPTPTGLKRRAPTSSRIAIANTEGRPMRSFGEQGAGNLLTPLQGQSLSGAVALGPDGFAGDAVIALAPFQYQGTDYVLRLDIPARELARQHQGVRVLTWVVLPTSVALLMLALFFLPHFLRPYDTLLEQVQRVAPGDGDQDEVSMLVSTVDRALAALAVATRESPEDDLAALQKTLGSSLESGLLLVDQEGSVLTLNALGSELLEIETVAEPVPMTRCLRSHPDLLEILSWAVSEAKGLPRQEIRLETSEGQRTLGFTFHVLRRDDGTVRGHLALFVDLTESHREAEARQLATSLEQLGELAAGVAHELRNSLATLRGYLTLIERHPDEESITDYLHEIRRESDHLQRVLEDFLSFAQPESVRVETVDLLSIARDAAADPALAEVPVEIDAQGTTSWKLQGDSQLLERALRNLLHNAARAELDAQRAGPIQLSLQQIGDQVELAIEDRGPGIPAGIREKLFQPFATGRSDGVGLGLSLSHRIVTLHGGRIRLEDRSGGGTRAVLYFPADIFV